MVWQQQCWTQHLGLKCFMLSVLCLRKSLNTVVPKCSSCPPAHPILPHFLSFFMLLWFCDSTIRCGEVQKTWNLCRKWFTWSLWIFREVLRGFKCSEGTLVHFRPHFWKVNYLVITAVCGFCSIRACILQGQSNQTCIQRWNYNA